MTWKPRKWVRTEKLNAVHPSICICVSTVIEKKQKKGKEKQQKEQSPWMTKVNYTVHFMSLVHLFYNQKFNQE